LEKRDSDNKHIKHQKDNTELSDYKYYFEEIAKKKGFKKYTDYQTFLAKKHGFKSMNEYNLYLIKQKGVSSSYEYKTMLAHSIGLETAGEYDKLLQAEHKQRPRNQKLAKLIRDRLKETGMNQSDLARKVGDNRSLVSLYVRGLCFPRKDKLDKILKALQIIYND